MNKLMPAIALSGFFAASLAHAIDCSDEPRFLSGTATSHTKAGTQIRELTLDVTVERIGETQCQVTTVITAVDDPEVTDTRICVETRVSEAGAGTISCDDGSFGTSVDIGSNSARRLFKPDGTVNVSGSAVDDGGERRRNITTRFSAEGDVLGYLRETLAEVEGGE